MDVRKELFENQDLKYKVFQSKLVPNISEEKIIGVRMPVLRKLAIKAKVENADFSTDYYDEILLKAMIIGLKKCSVSEHLDDLKAFVPLIDNWAVCDCLCSSVKFVKNCQREVWDFLQPYSKGSEFEIRFFVVMLMNYFFTDDYIERAIELISGISSDLYYVNMAVAWALSVAFVKYKDLTLPLLEDKVLQPWVHNKTIQKICESYRVDSETKAYLKTLKVK